MLVNELDRRIYAEELAPYLPQRIFDAHIHTWDSNAFPADFRFPEQDCRARFGGTFTPGMFHSAMEELLPEQKVNFNGFGMPHDRADRNVVPENLPPGDMINVIISPDDPAEVVEERINRAHAVGVKPYWNYAARLYGKTADEVEIRDMISPAQLKMLNRRKLAITLHIPRSGRFADPVNQCQMIELCENYPDIRIIFAHIGRAYFRKAIYQSNLDEFVKYPNVYFDTAMLNHEGVFRYAFDHFPVNRILFGSDAPIALLRGKSIEINNQYAYLMGENYAIGTTIYDAGSPVRFTFFYYEQLRALLNTVPAGGAEMVFFSNAEKLFEGIGR